MFSSDLYLFEPLEAFYKNYCIIKWKRLQNIVKFYKSVKYLEVHMLVIARTRQIMPSKNINDEP